MTLKGPSAATGPLTMGGCLSKRLRLRSAQDESTWESIAYILDHPCSYVFVEHIQYRNQTNMKKLVQRSAESPTTPSSVSVFDRFVKRRSGDKMPRSGQPMAFDSHHLLLLSVS